MKAPAILVIALLAGTAGWFARSHLPMTARLGTNASETRRVLFYQSPMHPWIHSAKPGKCTVCGMDLVPVFEGETPASDHQISLASNSIVAIGIQTEAVRRQDLNRTLRFTGVIDDDDSRHRILSAYVDGRVEALFLHHEGAEIVAGERLASIYSPTLLSAVREYIALSSTQPSATAAGSLLAGARNRLHQLGLSEAQISNLPSTVNDTHPAIDILSPMGGTVVKRIAYAGQYVKEGDPLFELADFSVMWLKFDAYERDLPWLHAGQSVQITTPSLPGRVFTNAIAFIDPNLDPASASAKVRVEIPNPLGSETEKTQRILRHRLSADVQVQARISNVLTVPRTAILNPGGHPRVFVELAAGRYEPREIALGRTGDLVREVLGGLVEGERVVTQGGFLLDAQAQLAGVVAATDTPDSSSRGSDRATNRPSLTSLTPPPVAQPVAMTPEDRARLRTFLVAADAVGAALAEDNFTLFNTRVEALRQRSKTLPALPSMPALTGFTALIPVATASSLPDARRSFYPMSQRLVELGRQLRSSADGFGDVRMYKCPMTRRAFPDAPSTANWIQLTNVQRNPWFGREMPDCGTEITP
jgi:Cu(I)/Ag(I) efflux system membrane fusion protein